jgi:hypothetical protein
MNEKCPQCGGRLIEKHDEIVEEWGKRFKSYIIVVLVVGSGQRRELRKSKYVQIQTANLTSFNCG